MIGIDFVLRMSSAAFTRGVAQANNSLERLKKSLKVGDVGNGLKQFLGAGAIIQGFRTAINNAQELRSSLEGMGRLVDETTASVARLGDSLDEAGKGFKNLLTSSLGYFTRAGEAWGGLINEIRFGAQAANIEKIAGDAGRNADRLEKKRDELLKQREQRNTPENLAKLRKTNEDALEKNLLARASAQEKLNTLQEDQNKLVSEFGKLMMNEDVLKNDRARIEEARAAIIAKQGEITVAKRDLEDKQKSAKDAQDRVNDVRRQLNDLKRDPFLPSLEEAASYQIPIESNVITGDMLRKAEIARKAQDILGLEQQALSVGKSGDVAQAIAMQDRANQLRAGLSGSIKSSDANVAVEMGKQLDDANKHLAEIEKQIGSWPKATP